LVSAAPSLDAPAQLGVHLQLELNRGGDPVAVELLLLAGLIAIEATTVVVVALVALVLIVARWSPPRVVVVVAPTPAGPAPAPLTHPLVAGTSDLGAFLLKPPPNSSLPCTHETQ
jgi:hypothetical protein